MDEEANLFNIPSKLEGQLGIETALLHCSQTRIVKQKVLERFYYNKNIEQ